MADWDEADHPRDEGGKFGDGGGKAATNADTHARMDDTTKTAHFSESHLSQLRTEYAKIDRVDPSAPTYQKMTGSLNKMSQPQLKQIAGAKIKFLSPLARNRIRD